MYGSRERKEKTIPNVKTVTAYKLHLENRILEEQKKNIKLIEEYKMKIEEKKKSLSLLNEKNRNHFHDCQTLKDEILSLQRKVEEKLNFKKSSKIINIETTNEQTMQEKTVVLLKELMPEGLIPFYVQKHLCSQCSSVLKVKVDEHVSVCSNCGYSCTYVLPISEFTEQESKLINKKRKIIIKKETKKAFDPQVTDRLSQYIKFLHQFHENVPDVPNEVIHKVLNSYEDVHIMSNVKIKPTATGNILRQTGNNAFVNMTQRIVKQINRDKNPCFTKSQIDRFCDRFQKLEKVFNEQSFDNRSKFANFTYLTRQFCLNDGLIEKAKMFENHKTKDVVDDEDERIKICYDILNQREPGSWNLFPSI